MKNTKSIFRVSLASFAIIFLMLACSKENLTTDTQLDASESHGNDGYYNDQFTIGDRGTVDICHLTGNGQYISISVNQNAVPAHLAHGDYLPDADGDGYSAIGACSGSMDDCDDNNPDVNPGNGCMQEGEFTEDPQSMWELVNEAGGSGEGEEEGCEECE